MGKLVKHKKVRNSLQTYYRLDIDNIHVHVSVKRWNTMATLPVYKMATQSAGVVE
jgi:hypothetical protein